MKKFHAFRIIKTKQISKVSLKPYKTRALHQDLPVSYPPPATSPAALTSQWSIHSFHSPLLPFYKKKKLSSEANIQFYHVLVYAKQLFPLFWRGPSSQRSKPSQSHTSPNEPEMVLHRAGHTQVHCFMKGCPNGCSYYFALSPNKPSFLIIRYLIEGLLRDLSIYKKFISL